MHNHSQVSSLAHQVRAASDIPDTLASMTLFLVQGDRKKSLLLHHFHFIVVYVTTYYVTQNYYYLHVQPSPPTKSR